MKIEVFIFDGGGIECRSRECQFRRECANHYSAGDFRSEGGFRPELSKTDDGWWCETADHPPMQDSQSMAAFTIPDNRESLGYGMVCIKDIEPVENFQI